MQTLINPGYVDGENSFFGGAIDLTSSSSSMLIVAVSDIGSGPGGRGRVDLFEQVIGAGFWHRQTLEPPNSYFIGVFGRSVSFDNEIVAVGSSTSADTGNVSVFTKIHGASCAQDGLDGLFVHLQLAVRCPADPMGLRRLRDAGRD